MKIPKKEVVKFVIKSVLHKRIADSQVELTELVNEELKRVDPGYAITGKRLRNIVLSMPEVKIKVETKKGDRPRKCPSCNAGLKKAYGRNLKGKKILDHLRCPRCGYRGHDGKWLPRKYGFWLGKGGRKSD
jgi:DNA-directed RNA polymerase subunit RPC12/RpoP